MRRLLAILLLGIFGLPLASPLFAASADQDTGLPACCRRNGAHHCSGTKAPSAELSQNTRVIAPRETCPAYPAAITSIRHNDVGLLTVSPLFQTHPSYSAESSEAPARAASTLDSSRHERGPPALQA